EDFKEQIENDVQGSIASEIQNGEKLIGVRVRLPGPYRKDLDRLKSVRIYSPNGGTFLLGALASITIDPGQSEITRENLKQMIAVTARISGRDLGSTIDDIRVRLKQHLVLPQNVTIQFGGTFETQQEAFRGLV